MATQVILELDAATLAELEQVAPSRSRRRSEFIRQALRKALDEAAERRMAEAYRRQPDHEPAYLEADAWEPRRRPAGGPGRSRKG